MNRKENASAIVMAILLLAFFMALSLNMYYLTRKKGEKSAAKARGVEVTGQIDGGSSLGYYELFLADQYVSKGFFMDSSNGNGSYTYAEPSSSDTVRYTSLAAVSPPDLDPLVGVVLNNYNEYFGCIWDNTATEQAILISEKIEDGKVVSRNWQLDENFNNIKRLWEYNSGDEMSIGGYRIDTSKNNNIDGTPISSTKIIDDMKSVAGGVLTVYYTKDMIVPTSGSIDGGSYSITYKESVDFTVSGSAVSINSDNGEELIVEKIN